MKLKKTGKLLCLALVLMLISMAGTYLMQANWGGSKVIDCTVSLSELANMIKQNNADTGKDIPVDFTENSTAKFHFRMFVPKNASASNPAPGIACVHGGDNTLEHQMPFYIELARRGYVVLSIDAAGHGRTDNAIDELTQGSAGLLAAVEYLMSLPYVDHKQIGVTGHSFGNLCDMNVIAVLNKKDSTHRIKAWVEGDGTGFVGGLTPELAENLIMTMNVGKNSEFDIIFVDAKNYMIGDLAKSMIRVFNPNFNENSVVEGQWYTPEGTIASANPGEVLAADSAISIYNNPNTHPGWVFSIPCTAIAIDGFYAAFGVPAGANYIDKNNQVWPIAVAFSLLGLIGFFMLLFPLVDILVKTPLFAGIRRKIPEREQLPSIKAPQQWIVSAVAMIVFVIFSYYSYVKLYPLGDVLFDTTRYPGSVANTLGFWTAVCGVFTIAMICVIYLAQRISCRKTDYVIQHPFESAKLDNISQFLRTLLFAAVVVAIMFIPTVIAYYVFKADFRICMLAVQTGDLNRLYVIILRYLPMWLLFNIPNAIFNANNRFKDLPDWISTVACAVVNCLALIILIVIQYSTIVSKGIVTYPNMIMGGIIAFCIAPIMAFATFSSRYIYKKTGNAWAAGTINSIILCLMLLYTLGWSTDLTFF